MPAPTAGSRSATRIRVASYSLPAIYQYDMCLSQDGTTDATRPGASHVGRPPCRCWPQAIWPEGRRLSPHPARSCRATSGARDTARGALTAVAARRPAFPAPLPRPRTKLTRWTPHSPLLRTDRSRSPDRRSGEWRSTLAGAPGARHPAREESQPRARPGRKFLERPISCPAAPDTARGTKRARLCPAERAEAHAGFPWS